MENITHHFEDRNVEDTFYRDEDGNLFKIKTKRREPPEGASKGILFLQMSAAPCGEDGKAVVHEGEHLIYGPFAHTIMSETDGAKVRGDLAKILEDLRLEAAEIAQRHYARHKEAEEHLYHLPFAD